MKHLSLLLLVLFGCQKSPDLTHFSGTAFDIPYHIQIGKTLSPEEQEEICTLIQTTFTDIHTTFNHWNPDSEISRFNHAPLNQPFHASKALINLMRLSLTIAQITEGRFDPTLGHATYALKHETQLTGTTGYQHLILDATTLTKTADIHIDLDAILKGYAIDQLIQSLAKISPNLYVEWGGEMRTLGHHPSKRPWRVLLNSRPLDLNESALATSGDAAQRFPNNTTHIIHPQNGPIPFKGRSVSIRAPSCALADALATALMLGGSLPDDLPDVSVVE